MRALKITQIMERLNVSRPTAYKLLHDGVIPGVRCGRVWRVSEKALETFLGGQGAGGERAGEVEKRPAA